MSVKPIAVALVLALPLYLASMAAHAASVGNAVSSSSGTASKSADFTAGETAAMDGNFEAADRKSVV